MWSKSPKDYKLPGRWSVLKGGTMKVLIKVSIFYLRKVSDDADTDTSCKKYSAATQIDKKW